MHPAPTTFRTSIDRAVDQAAAQAAARRSAPVRRAAQMMGGSGGGGGGGMTLMTLLVTAGWQGSMTSVRRTQSGPLDTTQAFEGTVTFEVGSVTDYDPPDLLQPLVPTNATVYVLRPGVLRLTHSGSVGPCSYGTGSWDVLMKKSDGFLFVTPGGSVGGRITLPDTQFPVTVTCPGAGAAAASTGVQMDLFITGAVISARVSGTMAPLTVAGSTFTGSWNFAAR